MHDSTALTTGESETTTRGWTCWHQAMVMPSILQALLHRSWWCHPYCRPYYTGHSDAIHTAGPITQVVVYGCGSSLTLRHGDVIHTAGPIAADCTGSSPHHTAMSMSHLCIVQLSFRDEILQAMVSNQTILRVWNRAPVNPTVLLQLCEKGIWGIADYFVSAQCLECVAGDGCCGLCDQRPS